MRLPKFVVRRENQPVERDMRGTHPAVFQRLVLPKGEYIPLAVHDVVGCRRVSLVAVRAQEQLRPGLGPQPRALVVVQEGMQVFD